MLFLKINQNIRQINVCDRNYRFDLMRYFWVTNDEIIDSI